MPIKKVEEIKLGDVRALVDAKIFGRGEDYFYDGRIINPSRNESEISAEVEGSSSANYWTSVRLQRGKLFGKCDCPYDWGTCKHVVALLLHWIKKRNEFEDIGKRAEEIDRMPRDDLLKIVKCIAKDEPQKFRELVDLAVPSKRTEKTPDFSKQVITLLRRGADYREMMAFMRQARAIREHVMARLEDGKYEYVAGQLFKISCAFVEEYGNCDDSDGDYSVFVDECLEEIARLWKKRHLSEELCRDILGRSWAIIIDANDPGFADDFTDFLEKVCCEDGWERGFMRKPVIQRFVALKEKGGKNSKNFRVAYDCKETERLARRFGYINKSGVYLQE